MEYDFRSFEVDASAFKPAVTASELRLGNWLQSYTVWLIEYKSEKKILGPFRVDLKTLAMLSGFNTFMATIEPIPLTPEALDKVGFVKDRSGYHMPGTQFSLTEQFYPCWLDRMLWPQDIPDFKRMSLKYMHQLQNLYFSLTLSEIDIKL